MPSNSQNPFSVGLVDADLFMADSAIQKAETMTSKAGKHIRGIAGYHLQQAAEKMIKYQIYASGVQINPSKLYRHSLDYLITYADTMGIALNVPSWVNVKKNLISDWEGQGR